MKPEQKIILDLAGGSGAWSTPYLKAGYRVELITLPDWDLTDERTIQYCCALPVYGILFATDCTCWAGSGTRWFWQRITAEVWQGMNIFFKGYRIIEHHRLGGKLKFWCIENPVGKLRELLGDPVTIFQPSDYGDPYTKRTLLWGDFAVPMKRTVPASEGSKIHRIPPSEERKAIRSITPAGFAQAFFEANQ
jgi:hypothetical protein